MHVWSQVNQIKWVSGLGVLAGLWEIFAPFVLGYASVQVAAMNAIGVGLAIAILAGIRFFGAYNKAWLSVIDAVLGIWLICAPFVLSYVNVPAAAGNDLIIGIIVVALGVAGAIVTYSHVI